MSAASSPFSHCLVPPADAAGRMTADVAISGGGMVGLALGIGFAMHGLDTIVVDAAEPAAGLEDAFDGRASAIAYASYRLLDGLGIWPYLAADASPINEIRVSDGPSHFFLHFDHREIGDSPLGFMVENRHMRRALAARADSLADELAAVWIARHGIVVGSW